MTRLIVRILQRLFTSIEVRNVRQKSADYARIRRRNTLSDTS